MTATTMTSPRLIVMPISSCNRVAHGRKPARLIRTSTRRVGHWVAISAIFQPCEAQACYAMAVLSRAGRQWQQRQRARGPAPEVDVDSRRRAMCHPLAVGGHPQGPHADPRGIRSSPDTARDQATCISSTCSAPGIRDDDCPWRLHRRNADGHAPYLPSTALRPAHGSASRRHRRGPRRAPAKSAPRPV